MVIVGTILLGSNSEWLCRVRSRKLSFALPTSSTFTWSAWASWPLAHTSETINCLKGIAPEMPHRSEILWKTSWHSTSLASKSIFLAKISRPFGFFTTWHWRFPSSKALLTICTNSGGRQSSTTQILGSADTMVTNAMAGIEEQRQLQLRQPSNSRKGMAR